MGFLAEVSPSPDHREKTDFTARGIVGVVPETTSASIPSPRHKQDDDRQMDSLGPRP